MDGLLFLAPSRTTSMNSRVPFTLLYKLNFLWWLLRFVEYSFKCFRGNLTCFTKGMIIFPNCHVATRYSTLISIWIFRIIEYSLSQVTLLLQFVCRAPLQKQNKKRRKVHFLCLFWFCIFDLPTEEVCSPSLLFLSFQIYVHFYLTWIIEKHLD